MKKIGVLGSGVVGQALANGFLKYGYQVKIGTSNTGKLSEWKSKAGANASVGSFADAASFGELIVLAVKGTAALKAIELANPSSLSGKTVIDTTNPIADAPPQNGVLKFFTNLDESLMEKIQNAYPTINFVKSFSCVGNAFMVDPKFPGGKPTMFICGNNEKAKDEVKEILNQFGWELEDMGKAESARAIEPLCMLWCIPGIQSGQWMHAFKLLKM
ncbi:MAG: NAD(P)-binding domain-containing protein [Ignavibacteriales bacterium]|nr:NAD(P)-binding domain-containing protein [Ignavibacteriales bacterium]